MKSIHRWFIGFFMLCLVALSSPLTQAREPEFLLRTGDKVAWIGSSSTNIGVWPKTMEFLLRTRHPELKLTFRKSSTGSGTFADGNDNLAVWLEQFPPTVVFFNYGGNDANAGEKGLPRFRSDIEECVIKVEEAKARVVFMTPQAADVRKSGKAPADKRRLYAENLLSFAKEKGWPAIDVHTPLEALQKGGQKEDDSFSILADKIHLTESGYIAWGYFLYRGLNPPKAESLVSLDATAGTATTTRCKVENLKITPQSIVFERLDEIVPILPPVPLPPRKWVPLIELSPYLLELKNVPMGSWQILVDGKPVGTVEVGDKPLKLNLNQLILDSGKPAPWEPQAKLWWAGKELEKIGQTRWNFQIRRLP